MPSRRNETRLTARLGIDKAKKRMTQDTSPFDPKAAEIAALINQFIETKK
jgi:hypothetical protein